MTPDIVAGAGHRFLRRIYTEVVTFIGIIFACGFGLGWFTRWLYAG